MLDSNAPEWSPPADPVTRTSDRPFLQWLGWTVLWIVATVSIGWIDFSNANPRMLVIPPFTALVVGFLCRRWNFLLAPVAAGAALWIYVFASSVRDPDSTFALDAGYQVVELVVAAVAAGSVVAAAIGVGIGTLVFSRQRAPVPVAPGERDDPGRQTHDTGSAAVRSVPEREPAPANAPPEEWLRPIPGAQTVRPERDDLRPN